MVPGAGWSEEHGCWPWHPLAEPGFKQQSTFEGQSFPFTTLTEQQNVPSVGFPYGNGSICSGADLPQRETERLEQILNRAVSLPGDGEMTGKIYKETHSAECVRKDRSHCLVTGHCGVQRDGESAFVAQRFVTSLPLP